MEKRDYKILWLTIVGATCLVAVTMLVMGWTPEQVAAWIPLKCPIYFFTGLHCPTCGLGRALTAAVAGEWRQSLSYHPFALPALCVGFVSGLILFIAPKYFHHAFQHCNVYLNSHRRLVYSLLVLYTIWGVGRWYL